LLKEKYTLASLRAKLEERQERECWKYRGFGHQAQHCRKEKKEKGELTPQNKFEILASRVMRCEVELRRQEAKHEEWKVECYKCREEGHKCKKCLLWKKKERVVHIARPQKVHQQRELACPVKGKAQEGERRLRKAEKKKVAHMTKPRET